MTGGTEHSPSMTVRSRISGRPVVAFILLTFVLSWTAWSVLALIGGEPGVDSLATVAWLAGGFGPPVAALVVVALTDGFGSVKALLGQLTRWRAPWVLWVLALLLPGAIVAFVFSVDVVLRDIHPAAPELATVGLVLGILVQNVLLTGGPEEIGWRGFALPRLQRRWSALGSSLVLGVVWILWHAPLFVIPGTGQEEFPLVPYILMGLALAIIFTWMYNASRGSLLLVVLLHGTVNAWLGSIVVLGDELGQVRGWVVAGAFLVIAGTILWRYGAEDLAAVPRQQE